MNEQTSKSDSKFSLYFYIHVAVHYKLHLCFIDVLFSIICHYTFHMLNRARCPLAMINVLMHTPSVAATCMRRMPVDMSARAVNNGLSIPSCCSPDLRMRFLCSADVGDACPWRTVNRTYRRNEFHDLPLPYYSPEHVLG